VGHGRSAGGDDPAGGAQIAGRFLFGYSIFWSDELAGFFSSGSPSWDERRVRRGAHPGVDSVVRSLPPRRARSIRVVAIACCLLFFLVMSATARSW